MSIIRITLKDPDGFSDAMDEAVSDSLDASGITDEDERDALAERRREKAWTALGRWVEYSEYVTLEFDTEAGTAVVVPRK